MLLANYPVTKLSEWLYKIIERYMNKKGKDEKVEKEKEKKRRDLLIFYF